MSRRPSRAPVGRSPVRPAGGGQAWAIAAIFAVGVVFAGIFGAAVWQQGHSVRLDPKTFCPLGGPSAVTVILVDATDPLTPIQRDAVLTRLERTVSTLREHEKVEVLSIDPSVDPLKPGFEICRPPKPEETSDWNGNKDLARQQFEGVFRPKLEQVLGRAVVQPESARSPIMEAVQAVTVSVFQKADTEAGKTLPKRLVIVSDLMENGEGGSHYRGVPRFEDFRNTEAYRRLRAHMDGIEVDILYLGRADARAVQGVSHTEFWQDYFHDQNASVGDIYWVEG